MAIGLQATTYPTHNSPVAYHSLYYKSRFIVGSIWDCVEMENKPNYHSKIIKLMIYPCLRDIHIPCRWSIDASFVQTLLREECDILSLYPSISIPRILDSMLKRQLHLPNWLEIIYNPKRTWFSGDMKNIIDGFWLFLIGKPACF